MTNAEPLTREERRDRRRRVFNESRVDYHVLFEDVTFTFKTKTTRNTVFDRMSVKIPKGRRVAILGPKRSGKSTLVKLIAGVRIPASGNVRRSGNISWPVGGPFMVAPPLTVRDNILFAANLLGVHPTHMVEYIDEMGMFGSKKLERVNSLPKHYIARLNLLMPLMAGFDCYLIDDNLPIGRTKLPEDRVDWIISEIASKDLILVTSRAGVARDYADTGAVLEDRSIAFCSSVEEAIERAGALPDGDEDELEEAGEPEEDESVDVIW